MLGLGGVGVLGFRVPNFGSRVEGLGLWDSDFGIRALVRLHMSMGGHGVQGAGLL